MTTTIGKPTGYRDPSRNYDCSGEFDLHIESHLSCFQNDLMLLSFKLQLQKPTKKNPSECHFGSLLAETGKESHCCKKAGNGLPMLGSTS